MVGNPEITIQDLERLVTVREYQGSSYGHLPFSGGDPEGHYRVLDFSTGVFSARDKRFNAYLRTQFEADILALYQGQEPTLSLDILADDTTGHDANRFMRVEGRVVEINYWSNSMRGSLLIHQRGYALTARMEGTQDEVNALRPRVEAYLSRLVQTFGLESTNKVAEREAA